MSIKYKFVWLLVVSAIALSSIGNWYEFQGHNLIDNQIFKILLSPFDSIRYGHLVARKLFLTVVAFIVFGCWLISKKNVYLSLKNNLNYSIFIGLFLLMSRLLTFNFWFYNDDTRVFSYHLQAPHLLNYNLQGFWGPIGNYPIAFTYLVLPWFGTNYFLYNLLGLFFYFLAGIAIYALLNKLQKNKLISTLAVIFFLTTPTYFQGRLLIGEIVNAPFSLLLVVLSIFFIFQKFTPGALIFAAAALEFGISMTYFIGLPMILFVLFFARRKENFILFILPVLVISSIYVPAFSQKSNSTTSVFTITNLIIFGDVLASVTIPHHLLNLLANFIIIFKNWAYTITAIGISVLILFISLAAFSYLKGKVQAAKLIIIGLSIILPCVALASVLGVRVDRVVVKLLEYHRNSFHPLGATGYGFFPAFGLTLILVGLSQIIKKKIFVAIALVLILVNTSLSIIYDYHWLYSPYSLPQRKYNQQLGSLLLRDNVNKYFYVPSRQRPFYQGIVTFRDIFRGDENYYLFMEIDEFIEALKKDNPAPENVYFLITDGMPNYKIHDYSNKIRATPYSELKQELQRLTKELTPDPSYFFYD